MSGAPPPQPALPRATIRLQFRKGFGFDDALALVPYFAALGVSHLYASPFFRARPGSSHGYDIIDQNQINPEIGDPDSLQRLAAALAGRGMGLILDFVPNHMGIGGSDNPWWLDMLEWGQSSPFAAFFDVDWTPADPAMQGKVLVPLLGDQYGAVLERGELVLKLDEGQGIFQVWYHDHLLPIAIKDYPGLLRAAHARLNREPGAEALIDLVSDFGGIRVAEGGPTRRQAVVRRWTEELQRRLAALVADSPAVADAVRATISRLNGTAGDPASFQDLHGLLERQHYRVAFWRVATAEINYRRFFDINDLAGLRMEESEMFEVAHQLVFRLIADGTISGLRLDHIDGLYDPADYCRRLQDRAAFLLMQGGRGPGGEPGATLNRRRGHVFYLLVEKILAAHERLREDWPVDGTTGYEVIALLNGLFVDPAAEAAFTALYAAVLGQPSSFAETAVVAKRQVMDTNLTSEMGVLVNALHAIARQSWRTRDFTRHGLQAALEDIVAHFPVYRTYVSAEGIGEADRRDLDWAVGLAKKRRRPGSLETMAHDFIHAVLTTDLAADAAAGYDPAAVLRTAMKFQQFTGPVMAKSVEDTAFYRYCRLVSLNEVGGEPDRFGTSVAAFHRANSDRQRRTPFSMVATATHDHKRGEDTRLRIDVLTEFPEDWAKRVQRWTQLNRSKKKELEGGPAPTANDEYLIYQMMVGSWPLEVTGPEDLAGTDYADRLAAYVLKAVREAKWHTSWREPNPAYEEAATGFVRALLDPSLSHGFLADFLPFQGRIAVAGALNGLAQVTLKACIPGIPDLYQGCEFWDLSLVDPDNRRPVDWPARQAALAAASQGAPAALLGSWRDGRIKQMLVARCLGVRERLPALFTEGDYLPLEPTGRHAGRLVAFERRLGERSLVVAVPRLAAALLNGRTVPHVDPAAWADTALAVPGHEPGRRFRGIVTGAEVTTGEPWPAATLFATLPVAVLAG